MHIKGKPTAEDFARSAALSDDDLLRAIHKGRKILRSDGLGAGWDLLRHQRAHYAEATKRGLSVGE